MSAMNKFLIIRFSSFGDIAQALPCSIAIKQQIPSAKVHWLTREDFADFVKSSTTIDKVWSLKRSSGIFGLISLIFEIKKEGYTHVYDAHSNIRSFITSFILRFNFSRPRFVRRPKERLRRFLLFQLKLNYFPKPFRGIYSFLKPLEKFFGEIPLPGALHFKTDNNEKLLREFFPSFPISDAIVLAPSATWEMKRWPVEYWGELAKSQTQLKFILLAGADDNFCDEIIKISPKNILDLRGKVSWLESSQIISMAKGIISGDTGLLHVADIIQKPAIAIIGPTAFGFPSHKSSVVAEVDLPCRPCTKDGRGKCRNQEYKKCLNDIKPEHITKLIKSHIQNATI